MGRASVNGVPVSVFDTAVRRVDGSVWTRFASYATGLNPTAWWRFDDLASPPSSNEYDAAVLARGDTVALWDSSGANLVSGGAHPLTLTGSPPVVDGPLLGATAGGALDFNGSNQYATAAYDAALNPAQFTMEAWFQPDGMGGARYIISSQSTSLTGAGLRLEGNKLGSRMGDGAANSSVIGATSVVAGQWYHGAITYDGTTVRVYLNGVLDGSGADALSVNTTNASKVGANTTNGELFDGRIARPAIHNTALSAAEIGDLFVLGRPVVDAMGNHNGGMIAAPTSATGAISADPNAAFDFNGSSDAVIVPYSADLNAATFSVTGWIYRDTDSGTTEAICSTQMGSTGGGTSAGYALRIDSSDRLQAIIGCGGSNAAVNVATLATGAWTHIAMTYNGTTLSLYRNGALEGTNTGTILASTAPLTIGAAPGGVFPFPGKIDELTYHGGVVLTAAQIAAMHTAGSSVTGYRITARA
jgi:hypothetical protein